MASRGVLVAAPVILLAGAIGVGTYAVADGGIDLPDLPEIPEPGGGETEAGGGYVVEHRYLGDILNGALEAGLRIGGS